MSQLYIPDKSWLICSEGMSKQQLKVTSQTTIKIAGGHLAGTIKDRTGGNFVCGKMLVAGAIAGAAIAAIMVSTGGLGFVAAAVVIAGSAVVGAVAGAALGTLLSLIPCLCALFTMPYDWIGCHPKVLFEKKQALLENATIMCMLGGNIEIIIFQEFADMRLAEIRKSIFMEAGIQALKVTVFLRFPKIFIFGNAVVDIALHFYTGENARKYKAIKFCFDNPNVGLKINEAIKGTHTITNNTSRFQMTLSNDTKQPEDKKLTDWDGDNSKLLEYEDENGDFEGTQGNAFRHTMWQAALSDEFGSDTAQQIGDAHEDNSNIKLEEGGFDEMSEADSYIDQQNNSIGRKIGKENSGASLDLIAEKTLDYYHENGLWESEFINGKYVPTLKKLPDDQYDELKSAVENMNRYGYLENAFEDKLMKLGVTADEIAWFRTIPKADY